MVSSCHLFHPQGFLAWKTHNPIYSSFHHQTWYKLEYIIKMTHKKRHGISFLISLPIVLLRALNEFYWPISNLNFWILVFPKPDGLYPSNHTMSRMHQQCFVIYCKGIIYLKTLCFEVEINKPIVAPCIPWRCWISSRFKFIQDGKAYLKHWEVNKQGLEDVVAKIKEDVSKSCCENLQHLCDLACS